MQFAEQLGHFVGTVQAKAEGWLDPDALKSQITGVRDAATALLAQVAPAVRRKPRAPKRAKRMAKADPAHAPGKRHRKPAPSLKGVQHSDERIAKLRLAQTVRQRRKY